MEFDKSHAHHREELKNSFIHIRKSVDECSNLRTESTSALGTLKSAYSEMVIHTADSTFLFCVDSFYFQFKSFQYELESIERGVSFVQNRLYCDYYKLLMMVIKYYREAKLSDSTSRKFREYVLYKDLEPFREYPMNDIVSIHNTVLSVIEDLFHHYQTKRQEIVDYYINHKVGHCISNLINTLEFDNQFLQNKIGLFMNYMAFFQISHEKHLERSKQKLKAFCDEVEDTVNDNCTFSINDVHGRPDELTEDIRKKYTEDDDVTESPIVAPISKQVSNTKIEEIVYVGSIDDVTNELIESPVVASPRTNVSELTHDDSDDEKVNA